MGLLKKIGESINPFGGIISGAIGIGQSLIDRKTQQMNIDKTFQTNKQLQEMEFQKNQEMWTRANEYNTPKEQMARFSAAGLNPNLAYSQGNSGNTATNLPKYQAPQANFNYKPLNLAPVLGMYQDFTMRQAQTDNLREQRKVIEANAKIADQNAQYTGWINAIKARIMARELGLKDIDLALKGQESTDMEITPYGPIKSYIPSQVYKQAFESRAKQPEIGLQRWSADIKRIQTDTEFKQKQIEMVLFDRLSKIFGNIVPSFSYKIK